MNNKQTSKAKIDIDELVADGVPSLPNVYIKLREKLDDPKSSFKNIASVISSDPALTARLLKLVNSSFYGFESEIETIDHAMNIIGTEQLGELALATKVIEQFKEIPTKLVSMESFWKHSIGCGVVTKILAQAYGERSLENYYLVGILHDIGCLVIYNKFPRESEDILRRCKYDKEDLFTVELEVLGFTHAKIGGRLLRHWNLPPSIYEAVQFHHIPSKSKEFPLTTGIVHLADVFTNEMKLGNSGEFAVPPLSKKICKELGFSMDSLPAFEEKAKDQFYSAVSIFL